MGIIKPFLQLIRWPNLVFIVLAQVLFEFCIYRSVYSHQIPVADTIQFVFLVIGSVLIAAGGNVINDYFDINIDLVNKPKKMVLIRKMERRWALVWHLGFSVLGVICTVIAVNFFARWYLVFANIFCVFLLWFYSARFKRDLLIGNIVVSLLTAWTILIIFFSKYSLDNAFGNIEEGQARFFKFAMLYGGFAFIISLIREALKDIEDLAGDQKFGCNTMPVAWGINATKVYITVWLTVLIFMLAVIQAYILQFGWWIAVAYCILLIILPLLFIFKKLLAAQSTADYHQLSSYTKGVMLTGILSMLLFTIYL